MALKFRCPSCKEPVRLPDEAAGKAVRCPHCEARIRVPPPSGAAAGPARERDGGRDQDRPRTRDESPAPADPDDVSSLMRLDSERLEDRNVRLCPKCAVQIEADEEGNYPRECPNCGIDFATRTEGETKRRLKQFGGVEPREFYGVAWSDPWQFTCTHWRLAIRLCLMWTMFLTFNLCAQGMATWVDGLPNKIFWLFLASLAYLGAVGTGLHVAVNVVETTMSRRKTQLPKMHYDFVSLVALGIRAALWPYLLLLPCFWFPPAWILPYVVLPVALVHMAMPYKYKAWLPWDMAKLAWKNAAPTLYWHLVTFVVGGLYFFGMAVVLGFFFESIVVLLGGWAEGVGTWTIRSMWRIAQPMDIGSNLVFYLMKALTLVLLFAIWMYLTTFWLAFMSVYVMRLTGLYAYYNRSTLDLVYFTKPGVPAGFWVRYLAFLIDWIAVFGVFNGEYWFIRGLLRVVFAFGSILETMWWVPEIFGLVAGLATAFFFFAKTVASIEQGTLGMWSMGLVVTDLEGRRIKPPAARKRALIYVLCMLPMYLSPVLMNCALQMESAIGVMIVPACWGLWAVIWAANTLPAAFSQKKQAYHDKYSDTLVCWKGDEVQE